MSKGSSREEREQQLLSPQEVADVIGVSVRTVLALPIEQIRIGPRTIRYRVVDVWDHFAIDADSIE